MADEVEVREERASSESDQDTNLNEAMEEEERKTKRKKRLLREAEKADKRGVCYLSRVPPHMDPKKLRQILSPYGEIQRLYLTPENPAAQMRRKKSGGFRGKEFSEGWVEFTDKKVAKRVAKMLNGEQIGGRKRSSFYYDLWNIKYLSKFKWDDLTEEIAIKNASREQKLALELSAAKRERDFYLKKVEQSKALSKIEERLKKKQKIEMVPKVMRQFSQKKPVANDTGKEKAQLSKDILAGVFGRINDDGLSINCNDQGVPFSIAKTTQNWQKLSDLLKNPDPKLARKLQPCELTWLSELGPGSSVVMIQVTRFHCGGFALGAAFWHKIVDAVTVGHFLKCWAHTALGSGKEPVCPNYISQYLFPRIQEGGEVPRGTFMRRGKSIMRRYLFDAAAISTLKSKLSSNINRPSRVEVVSALIWRCFMIASLANGKSTSIVGHVVDLRRRARPPFPSDCFGNLILSAFTSCANIEINNKSGMGELLVEKLRTSISKVDGEYIDRVVTDEGLPELIMEHIGQTLVGIDLERADYLAFSSWCNFGLYDVDFGWGKPVWINSSDHSTNDEESNFLNEVCLIDSRFGDGVEAWVTLDETYMEIFDSVEELRAVACKDPAPI